MKNFRAADKSHAGGDEKHDINFHWPNRGNRLTIFFVDETMFSHADVRFSSWDLRLPFQLTMIAERLSRA